MNLKSAALALVTLSAVFALAQTTKEIRVTGGDFRADTPGVHGRADLIEANGKRFIRLTGVKTSAAGTVEVYLVKKETVAKGEDITGLTKVKLGVLQGKSQMFPVSKEIDAWLYRSVTLWNPTAKKNLSSALLRSDQEKGR